MLQQVRKPFFQRLQIFVIEICFCYTAVVFQSTNSCYNDNCIWLDSCHTAFDIKEFLCSEIRTKSGFCDCIISQLHCHSCSSYRVTSVSNICKWSAVYNGRNFLKCLYQVRFQSILKQCSHSSLCMKIACCYRLLVCDLSVCVSDDDTR